jgi:DNA (cytosine-5)-methyltransferase 1
MSLGFSRAGFSIAAAYDAWDAAVNAYRANLGDHVHRVAISDGMELPSVAAIIGGPPCQGFSSAGARRAGDQRNTLVSVYARLIAKHKPRAFVFENVEGFLTSESGRFIFDLLDPLILAGYRIHLRKVNTANYGVPQHRKRVVAIGGLGWDPTFPALTHSARGAPGALLAGCRLSQTPSLDDALLGLPQAQNLASETDCGYRELAGVDLKRARLLKQGQCMRDLPEEFWHDSYRRRAFRRVMDGTPVEKRGGAPSGVRRLRADEPSKAITGSAVSDLIHPWEDRPLTIRECARLQTFPDDFKFDGTRGDSAQLIGNAVPPRFAEVIARSLWDDLLKAESSNLPGALLSFTPTLSLGMSPVLDAVTRKIEKIYGGLKEQGMLWG